MHKNMKWVFFLTVWWLFMLILESDANVAYCSLLVSMPPVNLMKVLFTMFTSATCFSDGTERLSAVFFKVAYQADKWKEGPPIISN